LNQFARRSEIWDLRFIEHQEFSDRKFTVLPLFVCEVYDSGRIIQTRDGARKPLTKFSVWIKARPLQLATAGSGY
jgi:hypothetical protein